MVQRRPSRRVGIAIAIACVVVSCRQIVGIEDAPVAHGGDASTADAADAAAVCAPSADACRTCLGTSCCAERSACEGDASCKQSFDCILACGASDESCRSQCVHGFDATLAAVLSCRAKSCGVDCGVVCGGMVGAAFPDLVGHPDCAPCAAKEACTELSACATDTACLQYSACLQRSCAAFDWACSSACEHPVGPSVSGDALLNALQSRCADECKLGGDWECVGKRSWPVGPISGDVTMSFRLFEGTSAKPLVGTKVRACPVVDPECRPGSEQGEATTDATGFARVNAKLTNPGVFNGYFELTGGPVYPSIGIVTPPYAGSQVGDDRFTPGHGGTLTNDAFALLTTLTPPIDPVRGHVLVAIQDCSATRAPNVTIDVSPSGGATTLYALNGGFSTTPTSTDKTGTVIVVNVVAGTIVVSARLASTQELVSQWTTFVRPGTLTQLGLAPLPR